MIEITKRSVKGKFEAQLKLNLNEVLEEPSSALVRIWLTFSLFSFAVAFLETIKSMSFLGGKIESCIEEKINELRLLAKINSKIVLDLLQSKGRLGQASDEYMNEVYSDIEKVLKTCGSSSDRLLKRVRT